MLSVDFEARRCKLKTVAKEDVPPLLPTLKRCYPLLLPIATLVGMLCMGFTPLKASIYATIVMILTSFLSKETRLNGKRTFEALTKSAYNSVTVCVACAVCGIVTGVITLTGLGLKLSDLILTASFGILFLTLFLTMIASIILGMGLPHHGQVHCAFGNRSTCPCQARSTVGWRTSLYSLLRCYCRGYTSCCAVFLCGGSGGKVSQCEDGSAGVKDFYRSFLYSVYVLLLSVSPVC